MPSHPTVYGLAYIYSFIFRKILRFYISTLFNAQFFYGKLLKVKAFVGNIHLNKIRFEYFPNCSEKVLNSQYVNGFKVTI